MLGNEIFSHSIEQSAPFQIRTPVWTERFPSAPQQQLKIKGIKKMTAEQKEKG